MPASDPQPDLSAIPFPSDDLSFGVLRKKLPELIDAGTNVTLFELPELNPDFHTQNLTNLLEGEREVATLAFNTVLGRKWKLPSGFSAEEVKKYLLDDYIRYGVASGEQHASQLIRDIESAAAEQARRYLKSR